MSLFTKWLPSSSSCDSDLVVQFAGGTVQGLEKARTTFERGLAHLGLDLCVESSGGGELEMPVVRFRISKRPISSMGYGCDVLAYVGQNFPAGYPFGLQDRSVLLCENWKENDFVSSGMPKGVIPYQVPFSELNSACGCLRGKGLIAVGLLTELLAIPHHSIRSRVYPPAGSPYFDAGHDFAKDHLCKKDLYTIPLPENSPSTILLNVRQAMELGLGLENDHCGGSCATMDGAESGQDWVASHVRIARSMVTVGVHRDGLPAGSKFRGRHSQVTVMMGVSDLTGLVKPESKCQPIILVPSDILEIAEFIAVARSICEDGKTSIHVAIDKNLSNCSQTVSSERLAEYVRDSLSLLFVTSSQQIISNPRLRARREGDMPADVGFVAWGSTQGVVREAVELCRKFGMKVGALFPKVLWPFPTADIQGFAKTVGQLVVVEPNRLGHFTHLIQTQTSLQPSRIAPAMGESLNPMDIFLNEGFPGHSS